MIMMIIDEKELAYEIWDGGYEIWKNLEQVEKWVNEVFREVIMLPIEEFRRMGIEEMAKLAPEMPEEVNIEIQEPIGRLTAIICAVIAREAENEEMREEFEKFIRKTSAIQIY